MTICAANKALATEVRDFIVNVAGVKEESISDFLFWRWHRIDPRFHYLKATPFDRHEESTKTGADFDLELWLIGHTFQFSLAVQAKKVVKPHDSYFQKLNYPSGTGDQLKTLLSYSSSAGRMPFYFLYTVPDKETESMCPAPEDLSCGIFTVDAKTIQDFAAGRRGKRISKNDLLAAGNPFPCMFCCPIANREDYFARYFPRVAPSTSGLPTTLPSYVEAILTGEAHKIPEDQATKFLSPVDGVSFRAVGVYDMRRDA